MICAVTATVYLHRRWVPAAGEELGQLETSGMLATDPRKPEEDGAEWPWRRRASVWHCGVSTRVGIRFDLSGNPRPTWTSCAPTSGRSFPGHNTSAPRFAPACRRQGNTGLERALRQAGEPLGFQGNAVGLLGTGSPGCRWAQVG